MTQRLVGARLHRLRRLRIASIACACLLGHLSVLAHQALVLHATCAEHGDSIHVGAGAPPVAGPTASDAGSAQLQVLVVVDADAPSAAADTHDHCSLAGSRSPTPQPQPGGVVGPDPFVLAVGELRDADCGPAVPHYVIAPKTSPPAADDDVVAVCSTT